MGVEGRVASIKREETYIEDLNATLPTGGIVIYRRMTADETINKRCFPNLSRKEKVSIATS